MNVSVLTLFPELYKAFLQQSLLKKSQEKEIVSFSMYNLLDYAEPGKRIDTPTVGHRSGMVLRTDYTELAVDACEKAYGKAFKIFLSPQGKKLNQRTVKDLWNRIKDEKNILLFAGRYEGFDQRIEDHYADEIVSVGDFITMGGDIPAMLLIEALLRYMPGVVGKEDSVEYDSFSHAFVDYPEYGKPVEWKGLQIPEILLSGNHGAVDLWREEKAAEKTVLNHFEWLRSSQLTQDEKQKARKYIPNHYVALMHNDIKLKDNRVGATSVTSLDIHDIARSSRTYGFAGYFVVTALSDQRKIMSSILDFWSEHSPGSAYNKNRHDAMRHVSIQSDLDVVIQEIEKKEGKMPIIIGTSARHQDIKNKITFYDQAKVWQQDRPVLILLGTGFGMSDQLLERCDYMMVPVEGFSNFNHLSVRSAAAIIFDRWLGCSPKV
jgi:tRNA (guanine37-N1)-methyltransferase